MICEVFGVSLWDQRERLTGDELLAACEHIDALNKAAKG